MKEQAQLIYNNFGEEKQRLKAKEERLELEIALNELALYDVREEQGICQDVLREELITDCQEEFADNVLMRMQLENLDFDEAYEYMTIFYNKEKIFNRYEIDNFYFSMEQVKEWVKKKIDRTMLKYCVGDSIKDNTVFIQSILDKN